MTMRRQLSLVVALIAVLSVAATADRTTDLSSQWHKPGTDILKNFRNMYQPCVVFEPGVEYPFKMWFFGWAADDTNTRYPGCDAIFLARARTLDKWEVYAGDDKWDTKMDPATWVPVVTAGQVLYDSWHNGDPSVVKKDGAYYMAFSSTGYNRDRIPAGQPGDKDGDLCCVMGATSPDGIHWTKTKRPILIHQPDIGAPGGVAAHGLYHRPSLMFDHGKWRCWFDYWDGRTLAMGCAECPESSFADPSAWRVVRAGEHPLLSNFPNPSVVKTNGKYYAYADPGGYGDGWPGRHICEAVSDDGITWRVLGHVPPEADTPATQIPEALTITDNGRAKIIVFYACQVGGEPYDYRYNRVRYMWRYE